MFDLDLDKIEDLPRGISAGDYVLTVKHAQLKETKNKDGLYISVEFVTEKGLRHWENFNIQNKSEVAQKIGQGQLKAFLKAAKFQGTKLNDVNLMLGLKVLAKIVIKDEGSYGKNPRVTSYKEVSGEAEVIAKAADPFV